MADEPKDGVSTSSFKVLVFMVCAPFLMLAVLLAGMSVTNDPRVKDALAEAIVFVVGPGVLGAAVTAWQYIGRRGDVSVAKAQANSSTPSQTTVNIEQGNK